MDKSLARLIKKKIRHKSLTSELKGNNYYQHYGNKKDYKTVLWILVEIA